MEYILKTGFSRKDITPEEYTTLAGFGNDNYRMCNNIIDHVYGTCVALQDQAGKTVFLCTVDLLNAVKHTVVDGARQAISAATGVPEDQIMVSATHTHAGPSMYDWNEPRTNRFLTSYCRQMAEAAREALAELSETTVFAGQKQIPGMTFVRHYLMNDGTVAGAGFGSWKSGVKAHMDIPDDQLQVIRFVRKDAKDIVLVNFQSHATITSGGPSVIGGLIPGKNRTDMSADYPGTMRTHVEMSLGCHCAFFQGACGNLVPSSQIKEEMVVEHDHVLYGHKLGDFVLECLDANMRRVNAGPLKNIQHTYTGQIDHSEDHRVPDAEKVTIGFYDIEDPKERTALLKQYGFNSYLHANQIRNRAALGATLDLELDVVCAGDIAFATAPYEMFNSNGRYVKDNSPFPLTFMMAYCNGSNSYIADEKAFGYDCYEVNSRRFPKGAAEEIASTHVALLNQLKEN